MGQAIEVPGQLQGDGRDGAATTGMVRLLEGSAEVVGGDGAVMAAYSAVDSAQVWGLPNLTSGEGFFRLPVGSDIVRFTPEGDGLQDLNAFVAQGLVEIERGSRRQILLRGLGGLALGGAILAFSGLRIAMGASASTPRGQRGRSTTQPGRSIGRGVVGVVIGGGIGLGGLAEVLHWRQARVAAEGDLEAHLQAKIAGVEAAEHPKAAADIKKSDRKIYMWIAIVVVVLIIGGSIAALVIP